MPVLIMQISMWKKIEQLLSKWEEPWLEYHKISLQNVTSKKKKLSSIQTVDSSTSCCRAAMKSEAWSSHVNCRQLLLTSYLHVAFILAWEKVCGNKCDSKRVWITFAVNFSLCHFVRSIINWAFELIREEKNFSSISC